MDLLKGVSRSFYLSLRLLEAPMRETAALAYLLARASDSVADCEGPDAHRRLAWLVDFASRLKGGDGDVTAADWPMQAGGAAVHPAERQLLQRVPDLLAWLAALPQDNAALVREVLAEILSGQQLDLQRFGAASAERPVVLGTARDLDDYTWRVAGCVGVFWTRLAALESYRPFADGVGQKLMEERAAAYGKGLQLVNILRDLPRDLAAGRCYLPVDDPSDRGRLMEEYSRQLRRASAFIEAGFAYGESIRPLRLRVASLLPAMLAELTLEQLKRADWQRLSAGVKVSRAAVYHSLLRCLMH